MFNVYTIQANPISEVSVCVWYHSDIDVQANRYCNFKLFSQLTNSYNWKTHNLIGLSWNEIKLRERERACCNKCSWRGERNREKAIGEREKKKKEKAGEYNSINRTRQKETEIMSFLVSWTNEFVCTSY